MNILIDENIDFAKEYLTDSNKTLTDDMLVQHEEEINYIIDLLKDLKAYSI